VLWGKLEINFELSISTYAKKKKYLLKKHLLPVSRGNKKSQDEISRAGCLRSFMIVCLEIVTVCFIVVESLEKVRVLQTILIIL